MAADVYLLLLTTAVNWRWRGRTSGRRNSLRKRSAYSMRGGVLKTYSFAGFDGTDIFFALRCCTLCSVLP